MIASMEVLWRYQKPQQQKQLRKNQVHRSRKLFEEDFLLNASTIKFYNTCMTGY